MDYDTRIKQLLEQRGITDPDVQHAWLHPDYVRDTYDPFLMHDMHRAVEKIWETISAKKKIAIYADYDADGIPGAVALHDFFHMIGYTHFIVYIPHRHTEGYGVHHLALDYLAQEKVDLIITIDVGIVAHDAMDYAHRLAIPVIITDHHEPKETLPNAYAIVNPKCNDYPDQMLCGAGVIFKVIQGLIAHRPAGISWNEGQEKWLLDMIALATLSDMVPLINENRAFAYFGLKVLRKNRRPGISYLLQSAGIIPEHLSEDDITFTITPRLNAASRMAHPRDAFDTLIEKNNIRASECANHLHMLNDKRKQTVAHTMIQVHKRLQKTTIPPVIVLGDPSWNVGVLGLIASKITETYQRPAFVWTKEGDIFKGSCRGYGSISVISLLEQLPENSVIQYGGHHEAGGFSAHHEHIHFLGERLCTVYESQSYVLEKNISQKPDMELTLDYVHPVWFQKVQALGPFGVGNPKPLFVFHNVTITSIRAFGKQKEHLELLITDATVTRPVKVIAFFKTQKDIPIKLIVNNTYTLFGYIESSWFRGKNELRIQFEHIVSNS